MAPRERIFLHIFFIEDFLKFPPGCHPAWILCTGVQGPEVTRVIFPALRIFIFLGTCFISAAPPPTPSFLYLNIIHI